MVDFSSSQGGVIINLNNAINAANFLAKQCRELGSQLRHMPSLTGKPTRTVDGTDPNMAGQWLKDVTLQTFRDHLQRQPLQCLPENLYHGISVAFEHIAPGVNVHNEEEVLGGSEPTHRAVFYSMF